MGNSKLQVISTSIREFLISPKDFLSKLLKENLGRLEIRLESTELYVMKKEVYNFLVRTELRKDKEIFEEKYRKLKERYTKVKEDVKVETLTSAQQTLIKFSNKFDLFKDMSNGELVAVIDNVKIIKLERGERVFTIHNTSKEAFFIVQGGISIEIDGKSVALLKKNTFFGEMSYITKKPRNATATVKSPTAIVLSIKIKDEIDHLKSEAFMKLFLNINRMLVEKVENTNDALSRSEFLYNKLVEKYENKE